MRSLQFGLIFAVQLLDRFVPVQTKFEAVLGHPPAAENHVPVAENCGDAGVSVALNGASHGTWAVRTLVTQRCGFVLRVSAPPRGSRLAVYAVRTTPPNQPLQWMAANDFDRSHDPLMWSQPIDTGVSSVDADFGVESLHEKGFYVFFVAVELAGRTCAKAKTSMVLLNGTSMSHLEAATELLELVARTPGAKDKPMPENPYATFIHIAWPHVHHLMKEDQERSSSETARTGHERAAANRKLSEDKSAMARTFSGFLGTLDGYANVPLGQSQVKVTLRSLWTGGSFATPVIHPVFAPMQQATISTVYQALSNADQPVLLDVGANSGSFTLLAAVIPSLRVHAFEPGQIAFSELADNVVLNNIDERVTLHNMAVGAAASMATLQFSPHTTGISLLTDAEGQDRYDSPHAGTDDTTVVSIDSFHFDRVDVLKIDTEGYEERVLNGAKDTIRRLHPVVVIELQAFDDPAYVMLTRFGYTGEKVPGMWKGSESSPKGDWKFVWRG